MQHIYNLGAEMKSSNDNWSHEEHKRDYLIMAYITIAIFIVTFGYIGYSLCYWGTL